jgi:hypothetical protein
MIDENMSQFIDNLYDIQALHYKIKKMKSLYKIPLLY